VSDDLGIEVLGSIVGIPRQDGEADDLYRARLELAIENVGKGHAGFFLARIELEKQRANDAWIEARRWRRSALRWRERCAKQEERCDELVETVCELKEKLQELGFVDGSEPGAKPGERPCERCGERSPIERQSAAGVCRRCRGF
jgi:hypothetical protein